MKKHVSLLVFMLISVVVLAQENQPQEQSKVTREYDEQGNLIRFDSTYVKSWSSDSTFNSMDLEDMQQELDRLFGNMFGGDSTTVASHRLNGFNDDFFREFGDSASFNMPGFQDAFPDMEEMQQMMMNSFDRFMKSDSTFQNLDQLREQMRFDFMNTPEDLEKIQEEFEKHFEQFYDPDKNEEQPQGGSTGSI